MAIQRHQPDRQRQRLRHRQQCAVHYYGDDQQQREIIKLSPTTASGRVTSKQRRRAERRVCARNFRPARRPDSFIRQQRPLQHDDRRFDAAHLSLAQKRDEPRQRHRHFRRDEQCALAHRRHDQQQWKLQPARHQYFWREHQQRGRLGRCAPAGHHQFLAHQPHRPVRQQQSCLHRQRVPRTLPRR